MKFKEVILICCLIAGTVMFFGCIKTNTPPGTASLNIINAINLSNPIVTDFTPLNAKGQAGSELVYYNSANQIAYGNGNWYESGSYSGITSLTISQIDDTTISIWKGVLNLPIGSIHSLFFIGDTTAVDTLFTSDIIPYFPPGDSVTGIRFVNLAQNAQPVLVTIQADTTHTPIANNIPYKSITAFQQIQADANALSNGYTFEFRDVATDSILATADFYNYTNPTLLPFKSVTICLIGQFGSNAVAPISTLIYPNY